MADNKIKLSQDDINKLVENASTTNDETLVQYLEDYKKGLINFNQVIKGLSKVYKAEAEEVKEKIRQDKELLLVQKARQQYLKKIAQDELKQSQSPMQRLSTWLNTTPQQGRDETAMRIRAKSAQRGIEDIIGGKFASGLSNLAQTFPRIANFMGGPYYLAIQTVIGGLLKFDSALAKASTTAASITGGMQSEYLGRGLASMSYNAQLKENLYAIGMQGKRDELISALQKHFGYGSYKGQQSDFLTSMAYTQKGLGSLGISTDTANNLYERLRLIEGKDTTGIYAQMQRLQNLWSPKSKEQMKTSPEYAINQMMSLADQTKGLGTNFEWASRIVQKFEKGLKDGTVALSDFAAVNRSIRGGGISKNAGIAALVADYASRNGINLPSGFANSNVIGQSFSISTQAMLSNNQFARAYQGQIQEMLDQIGGSTKQERAGALQMILQERGININPETAEKAIRSNGQIDLIGTGIIGSKMGEKQKAEQQKAEQYQSLVESYYKGTTSWHGKVLDKLDKVISNTGSSIAEGFEGNLDPNASGLKAFGQFVGYSLSTGIWEGLGKILEDIGKRSAQLPPSMQ